MTVPAETRGRKPAVRHDYRPYPETTEHRTGAKVSWQIYRTREEAEVCAEAAKHNAEIDWSLGYDFGYQMPGSIRQLKDGRFEVCVP
jgi:hypothetical protein